MVIKKIFFCIQMVFELFYLNGRNKIKVSSLSEFNHSNITTIKSLKQGLIYNFDTPGNL